MRSHQERISHVENYVSMNDKVDVKLPELKDPFEMGAKMSDGTFFIGRFFNQYWFAAPKDDVPEKVTRKIGEEAEMLETEGKLDYFGASLCASKATHSGYTDWRIPPLNVLNAIFECRHQIGNLRAELYHSTQSFLPELFFDRFHLALLLKGQEPMEIQTSVDEKIRLRCVRATKIVEGSSRYPDFRKIN